MAESKEAILNRILKKLEKDIERYGEVKAVAKALEALKKNDLTLQMLEDYKAGLNNPN